MANDVRMFRHVEAAGIGLRPSPAAATSVDQLQWNVTNGMTAAFRHE